MLPKIKICGLTNLKDALAAAQLGADAVGFIFADSPRKITPETAKEIISHLPKSVAKVGVFVNDSLENIVKITDYCSLDNIQLHGDESPQFCDQLKQNIITTKQARNSQSTFLTSAINIIKAFRIRNSADIEKIADYEETVQAFLFDTYSKDKYGGTGKVFNWDLLKMIKTKKPIIISGGLNPKNIPALLSKTAPYALDLNSGVEKSTGKKDYAKMKEVFKEDNYEIYKISQKQ